MIKVFEGFAGYGGASWGLQLAGLDYECVGYSEIDSDAIKCYDLNFPNRRNFGDISKINTDDLPDFDLFTGGFPCKDVSTAGQRDLDKGRTNLYLEILRIAKNKHPKFMLLENVRGLLSMGKKKNKLSDLLVDKIVRDLNAIGYDVCWTLLNSKDFGVPQSRERVWFVCKFGSWDFMEFQFPYPEKLTTFVKDLLESDVSEKYYLKQSQLDMINSKFLKSGSRDCVLSESFIVASRKAERNKVKVDRIFDGQQLEPKFDGISNTITTFQKDNYLFEPKIVGHSRDETGKEISYHFKDEWGTLKSCQRDNQMDFLMVGSRIRKLTPRECFRLMGFFNDEINLDSVTDTAKYSLAGNGWDISLASKILKNMFLTKK